MKPWRKFQRGPKTTPPLKIVPGGPTGAREAEPSYRLIFGFLGLASAVLALIIYFSPGNRWRWENLPATFTSLDELYRTQGMERFLEQKALLKRSVADTIREGTNAEQVDLATNIAVYLFPDVLPEENFEKPVAESLWAETLSEIEKHPHTAESRVLFEALRADIWNYELVDKEDPKLSAPARQVIQIYDAISAP